MCRLTVLTVWVTVLVMSAAEVVFIKQEHNDTQTWQLKENNTVLRTQFLPFKAEEIAEKRKDSPKCETDAEVKHRTSVYEMRDGKLYKVTRVKKKTRKNSCLSEWKTAQRRNSARENKSRKHSARTISDVITNDNKEWKMREPQGRDLGSALYNIIPRFSGRQWQTKEPKADQSDSKKDFMDRNWQFWTSSHPITSNVSAKKKEKIKKLLNLFTVVKFDNNGCVVNGLKGTCYHSNECGERGGSPLGPCARGFGVCCYIERTCGQMTNENCTYFVNEGFPAVVTASQRICSLSVQKAHPDVRQLRLEFETFELRGPVNGTCLLDRFLVTGQNRNSIIPEMCGVNTGQHMYIDVDATNGPFTMNVVTMGQEPGRKWRVKITQLRPGNELLAPQNCLQYFTSLSGVIESFNYQHSIAGNAGEAASGYFNNLNYEVCIKKGDAFCTITYTNQPTGEPEHHFELINMDQNGESLIPRGQAGAELFNCPDDYITVNGLRLCGDRLNDATTELDYTKNAPVTDMSAGPAQLSVRTDKQYVSRGFRLQYRQNPCLD